TDGSPGGTIHGPPSTRRFTRYTPGARGSRASQVPAPSARDRVPPPAGSAATPPAPPDAIQVDVALGQVLTLDLEAAHTPAVSIRDGPRGETLSPALRPSRGSSRRRCPRRPRSRGTAPRGRPPRASPTSPSWDPRRSGGCLPCRSSRARRR